MRNNNFWTKLKTPIIASAPLAGYTDSPFRQLAISFGAQVVYSEMVSATALAHGSLATTELMAFNARSEKNYVIQLFGSRPADFAIATRFITEKIKPSGIDLNCGCPAKKVIKQGAGSVLMQKPELARKIIEAILANTDLPLSIKIRSRSGTVDALQFIDSLKGLDIKAIMVHGRSLAAGFSGPVDTKMIAQVKKRFSGIVLANGGVYTPSDIHDLLLATGADGVGIGRGGLGNPWLFGLKSRPTKKKELFKMMLRHAKLVDKYKGERGFLDLRKHLVHYVSGQDQAASLRSALVAVSSLRDLKKVLADFS